MRTTTRFVAILALLAAGAVLASGQSLASLSKKNKTTKPANPSRSFTNEDLKQTGGAVSTSKVPDTVQTAAKPKGGGPAPRKASAPAPPPPPARSAPVGNQMSPVGMRQTVKQTTGGG